MQTEPSINLYCGLGTKALIINKISPSPQDFYSDMIKPDTLLIRYN